MFAVFHIPSLIPFLNSNFVRRKEVNIEAD